MADYKVCWTCRGLFNSRIVSGEALESHLKSCNGNYVVQNPELFEYFVCDKAEYSALTNLKKCLNKHGRRVISSMHVQTVLPQSIIKALLALCVYDFPAYQLNSLLKSRNRDLLKQNKNVDETSVICTAEDSYRLNKECQTNIDTSEPSLNLDKITNLLVLDHCNISDSLTALCNTKTSNSEFNASKTVPVSCIASPVDSLAVNDELVVANTSEQLHEKEKQLQRQDEKKLTAQCDISKVNLESFYICKLCSHKSKSDKLMLRHLTSHNDGHPFECLSCMFTTIWRKQWKQHLQRKHGEQKILCQFCAAEFVRKDVFEQHVTSAHADCTPITGKNKLQCDDCGYKARNVASLKEHKRKHTGEVVECPHDGCDFRSMYERSLNKHLRQKHSKEKTQVCYICGFQTRHTSSLSKHMMLHRDFKPYKCAHCSFTALYPSEIVSHAKNKHLKQKRFSCPLCQFQTSYPLAIQKHVERHSGTRGYACSVCGKTLDSMYKAKKHMMKEHGCSGYKIINESATEKVRPNDFKIKISGGSQLDDSYHVVVVNADTAKKEAVEKLVPDTSVNSDNDLQIVSANPAILDQPREMATSESLISSSLEHEANLFNSSSQPSKGGNPMLSATTNDLGDTDNSLIEDSLFDLMSDFPRPPALNRSQSASTLMFASFSPHVIDRSMTPDFFFTDSPSVGSFFSNFPTKTLDSEALTLGNLANFDQTTQSTTVPPSNIGVLTSSSSIRGTNTPSPVLPSFISSPATGNMGPMSTRDLSSSLIQETTCMDVDSMLPTSVLSTLSQLNTESDPGCSTGKNSQASFVTASSAFAELNQFSTEIQVAVASIRSPGECGTEVQQSNCIGEESPFPKHTVLKLTSHHKSTH